MARSNLSPEVPFAEVIESSLHHWLAQSWQWDTFPLFGSFVTITAKNRTIIGIVYEVKTGSMDPSRHPFANQKTEEELLREQPQIFEFLKTTFSCLTIGYEERDGQGNGTMFYTITPQPAKIHAFVAPASPDLIARSCNNPLYLHPIFSMANTLANLDELILALVKNLADNHLLTPECLAAFIDTFTLLIGSDYRRLKLFLQRLEYCTHHYRMSAQP